jgi:hypothetical protein
VVGTLLLGLLPAVVGCAGDFGGAESNGGVDPGGETTYQSGFIMDPESSFLVRDHLVVDDPTRTQDPCLSKSASDANKKWTFGYLMSQMANGATASAFARSWLTSWETSTTVNGDPLVEIGPDPVNDPFITNRKPLATLIRQAWEQASGGTTLAMNKAPFRLLAIVNRFDLRKAPRRFGEGTSGELRFVFSVLDLQSGSTSACSQYPGAIGHLDSGERGEQMVILEYAVDTSTADAQREWALDWAGLGFGGPQRGTPEFAAALQALTEKVVQKGKGGTRPNGSALIRIRTNETGTELQWDLREFNINPSTHLVVPVVVKQTPRGSLNGSSDLALWMQRNSSAIVNDTYVVPDTFPGFQGYSTTSFRGAHARNQVGQTFWQGGARFAVDPEVRHQFSMGTCSGCHSRETGSGFFHVHGRDVGEDSQISQFLQGDGQGGEFQTSDPVTGTPLYFNELQRRAGDLLSFLNSGV